MNLKDVMAEDLNEIFFNTDEFGEAATYNGNDIVVVPDIGEGNSRAAGEFERRETALFSVKAIDIPTPQVGDVLICKEKEWKMVGVASTSSLRHKLKFITNESAFQMRW